MKRSIVLDRATKLSEIWLKDFSDSKSSRKSKSNFVTINTRVANLNSYFINGKYFIGVEFESINYLDFTELLFNELILSANKLDRMDLRINDTVALRVDISPLSDVNCRLDVTLDEVLIEYRLAGSRRFSSKCLQLFAED